MDKTKTDLRVVKTKKVIKDTFLEMRKTIPLEKIHVRDICKRALINKSTFYCHYADAFALSEELEDEAITEFLEKFAAKDCLFDDPERFLSEMPKAFDENMVLLMPLFRDRLDTAFTKLKSKLKEYYAPEILTKEDDIRLTFIIGGSLHTLRDLKFQKNYNDLTLKNSISDLIKKLNLK